MTQTEDRNYHIDAEVDSALRAKALESLLIEKGLISTDLIDDSCANTKRISAR